MTIRVRCILPDDGWIYFVDQTGYKVLRPPYTVESAVSVSAAVADAAWLQNGYQNHDIQKMIFESVEELVEHVRKNSIAKIAAALSTSTNLAADAKQLLQLEPQHRAAILAELSVCEPERAADLAKLFVTTAYTTPPGVRPSVQEERAPMPASPARGLSKKAREELANDARLASRRFAYADS